MASLSWMLGLVPNAEVGHRIERLILRGDWLDKATLRALSVILQQRPREVFSLCTTPD